MPVPDPGTRVVPSQPDVAAGIALRVPGVIFPDDRGAPIANEIAAVRAFNPPCGGAATDQAGVGAVPALAAPDQLDDAAAGAIARSGMQGHGISWKSVKWDGETSLELETVHPNGRTCMGKPSPRRLTPICSAIENPSMATKEIDEYLAALEEPKRSTLAQLRDTIMSIVPDAEQCISYGMPAFKLGGKTIAGFAAFKNHLSYLPHSGSVIPALASVTKGFSGTKGSLHFPVDRPLPKTLVKKLLVARMAEASSSNR
jgi:uncharacterized protein YdhG (YjbR/CyaY superfamily)